MRSWRKNKQKVQARASGQDQYCCNSAQYWLHLRGPLDTPETPHRHSILLTHAWANIKKKKWLGLRHCWAELSGRMSLQKSRDNLLEQILELGHPKLTDQASWLEYLKSGLVGRDCNVGAMLGHYTSLWHSTGTVLHFLICQWVEKECESFGARLRY